MADSVVTIRLDRALARQLARLSKRLGPTRSDVVRDALRRHLALLQLEDMRQRLAPFAQKQVQSICLQRATATCSRPTFRRSYASSLRAFWDQLRRGPAR